jgi:adenosylcobinamide-phosphate synthase
MIFESALIVVLALLLDNVFAEPARYHPLVGFGKLANQLEQRLNHKNANNLKRNGILAVLILLLPSAILLSLLSIALYDLIMHLLLEAFILYLVIGRKSLQQHALEVSRALEENDLPRARKKIALIVSRDTHDMSRQQVITASIESIIENSNDAIYAALFWYLLAGPPGVLIYRLVNTLDAMWGYKNSRYKDFGWAAARFDDVLNWIPARLTVFSFAILSQFFKVWSAAFEQGLICSSKNAGPVMAAGASALNIKLGGDATYAGQVINKPELGCGYDAELDDIKRALKLVDKVLVLWVFVLVMLGILFKVM